MMEIPEEYTLNEQKKNTFTETKTTVSVSIPSKKSKAKFKVKDHIQHDVFGEGIVLKMENNIATIAFKHPHGIKKLNALHPSIHKI